MNKTIFISILSVIALSSCDYFVMSSEKFAETYDQPEATDEANAAEEAEVAQEPVDEISFFIDGDISHDKWDKTESSSVSFDRIPQNVAEFKDLQQYLGKEPQGCIALQLMAMEMYRRNKPVGEECLKLNNTETNLPSVTRRLNEVLCGTDSYARPHLVATYFEGANPQNGFNPNTPYTIKVRSSQNQDYQRSQMLKGYVLYLQVYSEGYDTTWRGVEVVKQKGDEYYRVSNCASVYVQCKEVDFDATDDYRGLI